MCSIIFNIKQLLELKMGLKPQNLAYSPETTPASTSQGGPPS